MRMTISVPTFASILLILSLACLGQAAVVTSSQAISESPAGASQTPEPPAQNSKSTIDKRRTEIKKPGPDTNNLSPRISFEKTVCDLGDIGRGTKNTCEFKFTNTGSADGGLKIGKIKRTCGCTVFELDRKEYATGRTGTIRVSYTAGKATALSVNT